MWLCQRGDGLLASGIWLGLVKGGIRDPSREKRGWGTYSPGSRPVGSPWAGYTLPPKVTAPVGDPEDVTPSAFRSRVGTAPFWVVSLSPAVLSRTSVTLRPLQMASGSLPGPGVPAGRGSRILLSVPFSQRPRDSGLSSPPTSSGPSSRRASSLYLQSQRDPLTHDHAHRPQNASPPPPPFLPFVVKLPGECSCPPEPPARSRCHPRPPQPLCGSRHLVRGRHTASRLRGCRGRRAWCLSDWLSGWGPWFKVQLSCFLVG